MPPVGIGILGAANIANKNIRAIGFADNAQVVAVGSRDKARSAALLARWNQQDNAAAYGTYDEVLTDPRVDAVYIALPSALHLPWVQQAAAAGKSILLEKPVAVSNEELDGMLEACREAGVQLMDGTMWMHNLRTPRMAAVLRDASAVGQLKDATALFCFTASEEFLRKDVRMQKGLDPQGALGDVGWYCVRSILWAFEFEAPLSVTAHPGAVFTPDGIPLHIGAELLFPGGRRGHFECGFDRALSQRLDVGGTLGTIRLDDFVVPRNETKSSFIVTSAHCLKFEETYDATQQDEVVVTLPKPQEALMWETFCGLVERVKAGGEPDPFWPRATELTQRILFAVERSALEGCREVKLSL